MPGSRRRCSTSTPRPGLSVIEPSSARRADASATQTSEVELFSVADHDGHLREVNDAFAALLGLTPAEVNGRSLLELVHPQDIAGVVTALGALQTGAAEIQLESRFLQRDGRWVHLQWVARPVPGTDLWWASGRNTTEFHRLLAERLELRARLDLAIGQATAAMWELDLHQGFFSWEPQATQILGVPAGAIPTSLNELGALLHPDDVGDLLAAVNGLPESGAVEIGLRVGIGATMRYVSFRGRVLDRDHRGRAVGRPGDRSRARRDQREGHGGADAPHDHERRPHRRAQSPRVRSSAADRVAALLP